MPNLNWIHQAIFEILSGNEKTQIEFKYLTSGSLRSQNYTAHPQDQLHPHAKFELNLTSHFWDTVRNTKCDDERWRRHEIGWRSNPYIPCSINAGDTKSKVVSILTKKMKTLNSEIFRVHCTCAKRKRCYDVTLSRQEGSTMRHWWVHSTRTSQPVETQDVFFWRLAGRSAPTGLAIVHWIGCINTIKHKFEEIINFYPVFSCILQTFIAITLNRTAMFWLRCFITLISLVNS